MSRKAPVQSAKLRFQRTPTLEQLEARLTFSIDALSDSLASLLGHDAWPTVSATAAPKNLPPAVATPVRATGATQITSDRTQLSVLGKDDQGERKLTYRWQVLAAPKGANVSFSKNNSNAAKQTMAVFNKAGAYTVSVTITDQAGLKTTANYKLNVVPSLTKIVLSPGVESMSTGTRQQFTARALDQFQNPLARQPVFKWSATAGSVNTSGLWHAPAQSTVAKVQVASGGVSTGLSIRVTGALVNPVDGFQNPALGGLIKTYFADGSITRPDMIKILRSAGIDGVVDTTELNDLRSLVNQATKYKIPDDVRVLAGDVVNQNLANSTYQGRPAGNLTAGASAAQLNLLIDKWFYGTDRPTLTGSGFTYQVASGSLFGRSPGLTDQKQGQVGDCYFISALGIIAAKTPDAIRNMFIDNQDGTFTVRFFSGVYGTHSSPDGTVSDGFRTGTGTADYVTVDRWLPAQAGRFVYQNYGAMLNSSTNSLWLALAEKAYAQWNATGKSGRHVVANSYRAIEGGWMSNVNAQVLGYNSNNYSLAATGQQKLIDVLNSGKAVTIGTKPGVTAGGLVGSHAYSVVGYNPQTQQFQLHNPWGSHQPSPMTYSQLQTNCSLFTVANPSQYMAINKSIATPRVSSEAYSQPQEIVPKLAEFHFPARASETVVIFQQSREPWLAQASTGEVSSPANSEHIHVSRLEWSAANHEMNDSVQTVDDALDAIDQLFGLLAEDDAVFA